MDGSMIPTDIMIPAWVDGTLTPVATLHIPPSVGSAALHAGADTPARRLTLISTWLAPGSSGTKSDLTSVACVAT